MSVTDDNKDDNTNDPDTRLKVVMTTDSKFISDRQSKLSNRSNAHPLLQNYNVFDSVGYFCILRIDTFVFSIQYSNFNYFLCLAQ